MNLSHTTLGFFIGATSLLLVHCSDNGGTSNGSGGSTAKGGAASAGTSSGGAANGGAANGGSANGGAGNGGTSSGGSANGGATSSGGASSGGSASGGASQGGASQGGASTGGKASGGNSATGGGNAGGASGGAGTAGAAGNAGKGGGASGGAGGAAGGNGGGTGSAFTLTSSKLAPGMTFPAEFTCANTAADQSPPFTWSNPPSGTMSYALVLVDMSISMAHWVLWDIPAATTSLAQGLPSGATLTDPAGAKQKPGFGSTVAYVGPCPNGMTHTYVFTLYALDVATLPNVTSSTSVANIVSAIQMHDLASATLSGTSNASNN